MNTHPENPRATDDRLTWLSLETIADLELEDTDCYRLASSPGCWVERFGAACLVSHTAGVPPGLIEKILRYSNPAPEVIFARKLVQGPNETDAPGRIWEGGPDTQSRFLVREAGLLYEVDFSVGYSCGLFLDQRANRARVRSLKPARVLNCFSFTCSFSVCGASVGAQTTSLDLSKQSLLRGRRNFAVNGLADAGHRFLADDVFDVLPRLARRGETFDVILLDPPTFSRGRGGRVFRVGSDLPGLVNLALACASPTAHVLISTNCSRISESGLRKLFKKNPGVPWVTETTEPLPDFPPGTGSSTLWLALGNRHRSHPERQRK
jgi:23S rRNA (cytosine1962-C5)-methyltransferase